MASSATAQTFSGIGNSASNPAFSGGSTQLTFTGNDQSFLSYTEAGVSFGPGRISSQFVDNFNSTGSYYDNNAGNLDPITFSFSSPTPAFAFNWGAADTTWTIELFSGAASLGIFSLVPTFFSNAKEYYGFSGTNITSASLTNGGSFDWVFIDNLTYAGAVGSVVPEPSTWSAMVLGFGLLGSALRYRRRATKIVFG